MHLGHSGRGRLVDRRPCGRPKLDLNRDLSRVRNLCERVGYSPGALGGEGAKFELGVDAQRQESPMLDGTSDAVLGWASLGW